MNYNVKCSNKNKPHFKCYKKQIRLHSCSVQFYNKAVVIAGQ